MPRILYVIDGLGTGGAERSLAELLPGVAAAGVRPIVACLHRRSEGVQRPVLEAGGEVRFISAARTPGRVRALRQLVTAAHPALIHTTIFEASLVARLAAAGTGVPVLTSLVNTPYAVARRRDPNIKPLSLAAVRRVDRWSSLTLTRHFHAITEAVKAAAVRDLGIPAERITVIERGRDPGRLGQPGGARRDAARRGLGLAADAEVVVNVGRQEHQKGQRFLLDAVDLLADARPRLVVLIAGRRGEASADLDEWLRTSPNAARVRMLGHIDDVPEVLAAADVFVFPSLWEGLGGSLIEAMALALPIVASDIPAIREVVEDGRNADLVPLGDGASLAAGLGALLGDPARRAAYGRRGRARFEELFTLERSTARMLELYEHLVPGIVDRSRRATVGQP